ncbi:MAG: 3-dehydroquinate synthase [Cyclobacteriaceae bacterium]|nr:3-dehydroquinate synthase [Cyclobacteriaceae bacterium]
MNEVHIQSRAKLPKSLFRGYSKVAVLVDENTRIHCYERIRSQLPGHELITIPAGEQHKNLATCQQVWQQMTGANLDRHAVLVALGGGVVSDLGGFCASTYKRGIDFILLPTTLLSMADASIGGKTGVDFGTLKNHVGTFALPKVTWIITDFLQTLPQPELRSGFAEVIKHCLVSDRKAWNQLRRKPLKAHNLTRLVRHSADFKMRVVSKDPREGGLRKILNFGHTIGHALEGLSLQTRTPLLHGEAIAAGMIMESYIAWRKKLLKEAELEEIRDYIVEIFGKAELPEEGKWMEALRQDKKNKGRNILMALPKSIGKAVFDIPVSEPEIRAAAGYYRNDQM